MPACWKIGKLVIQNGFGALRVANALNVYFEQPVQTHQDTGPAKNANKTKQNKCFEFSTQMLPIKVGT